MIPRSHKLAQDQRFKQQARLRTHEQRLDGAPTLKMSGETRVEKVNLWGSHNALTEIGVIRRQAICKGILLEKPEPTGHRLALHPRKAANFSGVQQAAGSRRKKTKRAMELMEFLDTGRRRNILFDKRAQIIFKVSRRVQVAPYI